jgi:hypothetical protein
MQELALSALTLGPNAIWPTRNSTVASPSHWRCSRLGQSSQPSCMQSCSVSRPTAHRRVSSSSAQAKAPRGSAG